MRSVPGEAPKERRRAARRPVTTSSAKTSFRKSHALTRASTCVISDIVKRRSIRVGSCKQLRDPSLSPGHFGARPRRETKASCK
jgi:hypothetical protein